MSSQASARLQPMLFKPLMHEANCFFSIEGTLSHTYSLTLEKYFQCQYVENIVVNNQNLGILLMWTFSAAVSLHATLYAARANWLI
jgi:hypothetical protein